MLSLSVIIPSYNRADVVDKTLESLTRQSTTDFQVVLVDHGSTDNTEEVCKRYQGRLNLSYYKISRDEDKFLASVPRTVGVNNSESEFIAFIDTGMIVPSQYAESHIAFHRQHKNYVGIGLQHGLDLQFVENEQDFSAFLSQADVEQAYQTLTKLGLRDRRESVDLATSKIPWFYGWTANLSMPRDAYLAVGGFDLELKGWGFEDGDLCYRLSKKGLNFAFVEGGWGIELSQERKPMGERFATHQNNLLQCYTKYRSLGLETLILRQMLLQKAAGVFRSLPTTKADAGSTVRDQMREEFMQQAEDIFNYLTTLGQESAILPPVPDAVQAYITQPTLLVGGTAENTQQYDYVTLADERVLSTPYTWSCSGVLIPLANQLLGTVVVSDIWKKLGWSILYPFGVRSMSLLEVLISEIARTAKQAIFVHSASVPGASVETLENLCRTYNLPYKIVQVDDQQRNAPSTLFSGEKA